MEQTGKEMMEERGAFEAAATMLIGRLVLEWSRFDLAIGLAAVWADEGRNLDQYSEALNNRPAANRVRFIEKIMRKKFAPESVAYKLYSVWIRDADLIRECRNTIIHSRFGIVGVPPRLEGARGLPTGRQDVIQYDLSTLQGYIDDMVRLQSELNQLRDQHPL